MRFAIFFSTILLILLQSCIDKIDYTVERGAESAIVVKGKLVYGDPSYVRVSVERLFAFDAASRSRVLSRGITLIDEAGREYPLKLDAISTYEAYIPLNDPNFPIEIGKSYKIRVETLNDGILESSLEKLYPVPKTGEISVDSARVPRYDVRLDQVRLIPIYDFFVGSNLSLPDQKDKARLLWINERFSLLPPSGRGCNELNSVFLSSPVVYDGNDSRLEQAENIFLSRVIDFNFDYDQACIALFQESLSPGAYTYWEQVSELTVEREATLLDPRPGQVGTNIYKIGEPNARTYGYFYATERDTIDFALRR